MKKRFVLFMLFAAVILLSEVSFSADILGCPNGILKGTIWPRFSLKMYDASEKWNKVSEEMVDISEGAGVQSQTKKSFDFRLGYGLLKNLDIGLNLKYGMVETEKKKSPTDPIKEFTQEGLTDLWLSGKYMFIDTSSDGFFEYLKLSFGISYAIALNKKDEALIAGLTPGVDQSQSGLLIHGGLAGLCEYAGHLLYHYKGTAPEVQGFGRSGQDIPDTVNYMYKLEKGVFDYLGIGIAATGFFGVQEDLSLVDASGESLKPYCHNIMLMLEIFPFKYTNYEKRKFFLMLNLPYAVRTTVSPDYSVNFGIMYSI